MTDTPPADAKFIIGPYGTRLSIADLPPPSTERWVIRRKAEVVAAVKGGLLSFEEALKRYELPPTNSGLAVFARSSRDPWP